MKFNVFALALICALSVAPVVATTAPAAKKAEVKKEVKATETEVAAKDVEVSETKTETKETPATDAKATDACPSCK